MKKTIIDLVLVFAILSLMVFIVERPVNRRQPIEAEKVETIEKVHTIEKVDTIKKVHTIAQEERAARDGQVRWDEAVLDGTITEDNAVKMEFARGVDLNQAVDRAGDTPMHIACMDGCMSLLRFLADSGVKLNLENKSGETPLDTAILNNHIYAVEYLVHHNARTAAITIDDKGCLSYKSERLNGVDPSIQNLLRVFNAPPFVSQNK
jgi:Ankyrin repeats (3 copies)